MKKLSCFFLTFVMFFVTSASISAYAVDEPYVVSVITYDEIKDPELLLQTAVARSKARGVSNITLYGDETDDKAVVKQVLKETTYSDGHIEQDSVLTGISFFEDVNGKFVARNPINIDNFEQIGATAGVSATMSINVHSQFSGETIFSEIIARITSIKVSITNSSLVHATKVDTQYHVKYEFATQVMEKQSFNLSSVQMYPSVTMYTKDGTYYRINGGTHETVSAAATVHASNNTGFTMLMELKDYFHDPY